MFEKLFNEIKKLNEEETVLTIDDEIIEDDMEDEEFEDEEIIGNLEVSISEEGLNKIGEISIKEETMENTLEPEITASCCDDDEESLTDGMIEEKDEKDSIDTVETVVPNVTANPSYLNDEEASFKFRRL